MKYGQFTKCMILAVLPFMTFGCKEPAPPCPLDAMLRNHVNAVVQVTNTHGLPEAINALNIQLTGAIDALSNEEVGRCKAFTTPPDYLNPPIYITINPPVAIDGTVDTVAEQKKFAGIAAWSVGSAWMDHIYAINGNNNFSYCRGWVFNAKSDYRSWGHYLGGVVSSTSDYCSSTPSGGPGGGDDDPDDPEVPPAPRVTTYQNSVIQTCVSGSCNN